MLSIRRCAAIAVASLRLSVVSLSVGCAATSSSAMPERFDAPRASAEVAGLSCPLCAESLIATVEGVEGVESAWLDLEAGRLTLTFGKTPPTPAQVARSIENAGFTLVSFGPAVK